MDHTADTWPNYRFKRTRKWLKISHEIAGIARKTAYLQGTVLTPKSDDVRANLGWIAHAYRESNLGLGPTTLDEYNTYQKCIADVLQVYCNHTFSHLAEGLYPIDPEFAGQLAADKLPQDLDELIWWDSGVDRARDHMTRWGMWVIAENSR